MKKILFLLIILGLGYFGFRYLTSPPKGTTTQIKWGAAFSKPFAIDMGLEWKKAYLAILDDLKPKSLRLPVYWRDVEPSLNEFDFSSYDWMTNEANKRGVKLILAVGRKSPRWPECNEPSWSKQLDKNEFENQLINYVKKTINRYSNLENLYLWQIENEPFLSFGECPQSDSVLLDKEIALARKLDPNHKIMVTDSGELSIWFPAAKRADVFGTTMYRIVYNKYFGYVKYPLSPKFFWIKANLVRLFYPNKPIIVSELQAEPWGPKMIYETPISEQFETMDINQFRSNIEYAKAVGFQETYLWGAEWWYWLKTKHNNPDFWNEAKQLFKS